MKFGKMTHIGPFEQGGRRLENKDCDISAMALLIFTKFDAVMQNGTFNRPDR